MTPSINVAPASTRTLRSDPLATWTTSGRFHGTRPRRAPATDRTAGAGGLAALAVGAEPCELLPPKWTAATTTPATASAPTPMPDRTTPRDEGRTRRMPSQPLLPCSAQGYELPLCRVEGASRAA